MGFSNNTLLKDDSFDNLKFKEAWTHSKENSYFPVISWPTRPTRYRAKKPANVYRYDDYESRIYCGVLVFD